MPQGSRFRSVRKITYLSNTTVPRHGCQTAGRGIDKRESRKNMLLLLFGDMPRKRNSFTESDSQVLASLRPEVYNAKEIIWTLLGVTRHQIRSKNNFGQCEHDFQKLEQLCAKSDPKNWGAFCTVKSTMLLILWSSPSANCTRARGFIMFSNSMRRLL
jgi:hypothetical protein